MRIREWEPAGAPDSEIEAWRRAMNEVVDADLPTEPRWGPDRIREYLSVTMPEERRICWLAEEHGEAVGFVTLILLSYDTAGTGVLDLFTRPGHRRAGVASALLSIATQRAAEEGRRLLTVEVIGGTPAVDFYRSRGFTRTVTEERHLLDLTTVDWAKVRRMARRIAAGYRIDRTSDGPPDELLASYADAKLVVRHTPLTDVEWHADFEMDRLRDSLRTLRARGQRPYITIAVHNTSNKVAGLTELVVPAQRPERADQYDTLVVPTHRGYGLGLAMKARMLLDLHTAEPQVHTVQTWHDTENEPMARVNAELGFRPDREWHEYEVEIASLTTRKRTA